ncbi:MAG: hypothetical protein LC772_11305 [Chloroflexi bacterium]|nr:hypothetical protein [Chloroflexota bacterium]
MTRLTDFEQKVLEDLSGLKVQMHQLMGIGQPGRLQHLEGRVESHERGMQRMKGLVGALAGSLTLAQLLMAYLGGRHS